MWRRGFAPEATAAPATVSGEPHAKCHWDAGRPAPGKAAQGDDPQARKPAVRIEPKAGGVLRSLSMPASLPAGKGARIFAALPL